MYPTPAQILARPVRFRPGTLELLSAWRQRYRGQLRTPDAVTRLLEALALLHDRPVAVTFVRGHAALVDAYDPWTQTIALNRDRLSVVTALHEFAHHLYGPSELRACRWSVWLFRATFPRTYARLTWRGHLLVRG